MQRSDNLLIVGIDPGTTLGYALLDLSGNLIAINSSKNQNLSYLISDVIKYGRPIIAAVDVSHVPSLLKEFSAKTGSVLILPKKDLLVDDKRKLSKNFKTSNIHESDALASALFAYHEISPLLAKINLSLKKQNKLHLEKKVRELVIKDKFSIHDSIDILEEPKPAEISLPENSPPTISALQSRITELQKKFRRTIRENLILRGQVGSLINEKEEAKSSLNKILKKQFIQKKDKYLIEKQKQLNAVFSSLESANLNLTKYKTELSNLNYLIASLSSTYLLKKLDNLGKDFETKNKLINIQPGDMLLVDNLDISSQKTIDYLKDKISLILYKKGSKKSLNIPFNCISLSNLRICETENFASIKKSELNNIKSNKEMIKRIIDEYRNQR